MAETRSVATSAGPVEVLFIPGALPPVLFFPGGHCSAGCDCGWSLYRDLGYSIVSFSRPGYGGTRVGSRSAAESTPLIREVCQQLGITSVAAAVGVSFGGMQAVHVANDPGLGVPCLVLHSCAPSVLPYPDRRSERVGGSILFSPLVEGLVWRTIRRTIRSDAGLQVVMARLSTLPIEDWWPRLTSADRAEARALFESMGSDSGFVNDLRQGRPSDADLRLDALSNVSCPTLVTGSRHDRGVPFAYAENLAQVIPGAVLVELTSPSHIFWIGPERAHLTSVVRAFINEVAP